MNSAVLKKLGLNKVNNGTSTGLKSWKGKSEIIKSYSPVEKPSTNGEKFLPLKEVKSSDNMEKHSERIKMR